MTPQPAGHSRHTVENQDATPGTICSFGTTSGSSFSVACWQPAAAALAPVVATILKKSRRLRPRRGASPPFRRSSLACGSLLTASPQDGLRGQSPRSKRHHNCAESNILRGSLGSPIALSVVTGDAVERRVGAAFCVLVAVAVDAPAHR